MKRNLEKEIQLQCKGGQRERGEELDDTSRENKEINTRQL